MTNRLAVLIDDCLDRMDFASAQRWHRQTVPAAATIESGAFYLGGPTCLVARDASGALLQTIRADVAAASPFAA